MGDYVGAILAAGRGTRMGSLGYNYPKPLLPVANEPLIVRHLRILRSLEIDEVFIIVGHRATQIVHTLGEGSDHGVRITYVDQDLPLGSAYALGRLAAEIDSPFVLFLGDYFFFAPELVRMLKRAKSNHCSVIAAKRELNWKALQEACVLEVNGEGRVCRIIEKPKMPTNDLKGCGIYVFQPDIFDALQRTPRTALRNEYELTVSVELYIQAGYPLYAEEVVEWDTNFTCPEDVLSCNMIWLDRHGERLLIGDNVQLANGTRLDQVIIGDDVVVSKPSVLKDVVVFRGVQINGGGKIERALVTPKMTIQCAIN